MSTLPIIPYRQEIFPEFQIRDNNNRSFLLSYEPLKRVQLYGALETRLKDREYFSHNNRFYSKTAILPSFLIKSLTYIQKKEIEANAPIPIYLTTNCMEVWRKALTCHQVYRTLLLLYIPNT